MSTVYSQTLGSTLLSFALARFSCVAIDAQFPYNGAYQLEVRHTH